MLCRLAAILLFLGTSCVTFAQDFIVDLSKKTKNDFAKSFVKLVNDAPSKFKEVKDKPVKGVDSLYPNSKVFHCKVKIPGAISGKLILDSLAFAEFHFGDFDKLEDAEASFVNLSNTIAEAMNRKVMFRNNDTAGKLGLIRQTKIAYTLQSGFFHYNVFVQLYKKQTADGYRLLLKINGGQPKYYYKVMKTEPISSFMFATALKNQLGSFQKNAPQGCLGELPPFACKGIKMVGDTTMIVYVKTGFKDLPDGKKEFEAALTNLRVCLGEDYVYYLLAPHDNRMREVAFLKIDDIEKRRSKTIHLTLIGQTATDYMLELGFAY